MARRYWPAWRRYSGSPAWATAFYTEDQLRTLRQARTRVRLSVEQQADGTLKGYGFYTGKHRDWEMVDVVQFTLRGTQQVADLGDGIELIWTPAVDGSDILGIPKLEAAPQAPHIWVYPPTKAADGIIVNPIYPPDYKDFILVFPVGSLVQPVYIVVSVSDHKYYPAPTGLSAFPDAARAPRKTPIKGGGGLRKRWKSPKGPFLNGTHSTELSKCTTNVVVISVNMIQQLASRPNPRITLGKWNHDLRH